MTLWNQWIVRNNISAFKRKIEEECDPAKRRVLETLLAQEETRLGDREDTSAMQEQHERTDERNKNDSEHWRMKALSARRMAVAATDRRSRQRLLDMAASYERLERLAEEALARHDLPEAQ